MVGQINHRDFERMAFWPEGVFDSAEHAFFYLSALLERFENVEDTRMDFRPKLPVNEIDSFKELVKALNPRIEIGEVMLNGNGHHELHVCLNKGERLISDERVADLRTTVQERIDRAMRETVLSEGTDVNQKMEDWRDFSFCKHGMGCDFNSEELLELWGQAHNLNEGSVARILQDSGSHHIFGMRNSDGRLVAALMFVKDGEKWESTEWATCQSQRGRGLIEGLLLVANAWAVSEGLNVYAHLRHKRSDRIGVQTGMKVDVNDGGPLTHHAVIDRGVHTEDPQDGDYGDTRHVWVATLDHGRFNENTRVALLTKLT